MDSFRLNQIAMVFLGTVFILFSLSLLSEALFHSEAPEQPGYAIAASEGSGGESGGEAAGPAYDPIAPLLANADLAAGEAVFKKCASCHTSEEGGPNKVGPNLWGVVTRPIASHEGFNYSAAIKEYGAGKTWTYDELNGFLFKPKDHIPGTAMGFAGLKKTDERANLIAWLRTHSANPAPLPSADASADAGTDAGAGTEGGAATEATAGQDGSQTEGSGEATTGSGSSN
ncbi:MAG: cytochrome c family protein [Nitratireductor sp.]|nr:cytochrome c family protein [Nitratireductor sp.]